MLLQHSTRGCAVQKLTSTCCASWTHDSNDPNDPQLQVASRQSLSRTSGVRVSTDAVVAVLPEHTTCVRRLQTRADRSTDLARPRLPEANSVALPCKPDDLAPNDRAGADMATPGVCRRACMLCRLKSVRSYSPSLTRAHSN